MNAARSGTQPEPRGPLGLNWNVWVLAATSFLRDVASEMLVHLLPLFLANVLGVRTAVIGLIEGLAETTSSLTKIYAGWLSDRLGRRKGLTVAGYGVAAFAIPILIVARSWPVVLLARFADRLGKGIRTAPRDALIADSVDADRRGVSFGVHRAADSGGAFTGLLVAIAIVWTAQRGAVSLDAATFHRVLLWALVPAFLAVVVVGLGVREVRSKRPADAPRLTLEGLGSPFRRFLVVMVLFTLGNSSDAFLVLRAQSVGASVVGVLALIAGFNLVYAILAGPVGALSDRIDRRVIIVAGWFLYALVYLGFGSAGNVRTLAVLYVAYGVYYALTEGVAKALVADFVPADRRGTAYGVYNAAVGIAALPASLIAGILWQGVAGWSGLGPAAPFAFGGSLAVMAAALLWFWVPTMSTGA